MFEFESLVSLPKRLETSATSTVGQGVIAVQDADGLVANNNLEACQYASSSAIDNHGTFVDISIDN